jgi:hypothetical protein
LDLSIELFSELHEFLELCLGRIKSVDECIDVHVLCPDEFLSLSQEFIDHL